MNFIIRTISNAFALWVATFLLSGVRAFGPDLTTTATFVIAFVVAGAVLALANMIVRPIVKFFSFPFYLLTLGLFFVIVNALMILLTAWVSEQLRYGIIVDGFWWAVAAGIIVGLVNWLLSFLVPKLD